MGINLISVQIIDDAGRSDSVLISVPDTTTLAEIQAWLDTNATYIDGITGGKLNKASVSLALTLPAGLKSQPLTDHPVQWGANFGFSANGTNYRHTVRVPAIAQTMVTAGAVDTSGASAQGFIGAMVSGSDGVLPTDRYENDLNGFIEASPTFRK